MFVVILVTLLFSVRGSNADTGADWGRPFCDRGYCITLSEGEITAEAGLCVVIPCLFTTGYGFIPQHIVWYKCEPSKQRCGDSDIIFHTNKNNKKVQSGFKGRMSLLEPDVTQGNCSIIVNDLTESDSGSYQLRVNGKSGGFGFLPKATVSVKGLTQKPTVMIPPLTEGQQTTLTCTTPGLCSGSDPEITWMWRGAGEADSHTTGNITAFKTEDLTAVTQRHSSTLTFNPSAKHHGTDVTCKVSFTNNITTEETVTLNVTYVKEVKITGNTSVKEGEALSLICSVESFPPALITWTKYSDEMQNKTETILQNNTVTDLQNNTVTDLQNNTVTDLQNDTVTDLQNDTVTDLQNNTETFLEKSGMDTFSILNVTTADAGLYICTAKHQNNTLMGKVNVTVIYMRKLVITGDTTVEKGDALNLTCSVESFPPSHVTWTVRGSNTNLQSGPDSDLQKDTGSATLFIPDVTAEHSGQYICTAQHLDTTVTTYADITVTWFSKILETSGCVVQSEVLTCVCISEGFPLPTIKWPLLKNRTEYSVVTTVSNHMVNSTATVTVKDHSTSVECVSSNTNGEAKENLTIRNDISDQDGQTSEVLKIVSRPEVIIAFVIGVVLSAVLCCLANKCHRKKQKSSGNLEVVTGQEYPLIDAGQTVEDDQTYYQEAAEEGGAVAAEKATSDLNGGPKDVEYASIDFSVMKRRSPREAAKKQETTETEYAEIKKTVKKETEENGKEEGEVLEGKEEQAMIEEDEETKQYVPEEEEGEEMAVYSSVKDVMDEM
ncbi:sialic acid-binding Ig-like lectin 10 isoform X3 [Epinephelus fuscoguttatus]|uniref:sialic acid-binding Ig-like lectin 10 isoform X3 n=1 Tax=Epinephelus fuscoguttatus TaxID=293821 RepID=UPI0020D0C870|nr:sialic acid-binding Ig-like lectin 10 isoform X3 [Epinephelus fuscoguttatus]